MERVSANGWRCATPRYTVCEIELPIPESFINTKGINRPFNDIFSRRVPFSFFFVRRRPADAPVALQQQWAMIWQCPTKSNAELGIYFL